MTKRETKSGNPFTGGPDKDGYFGMFGGLHAALVVVPVMYDLLDRGVELGICRRARKTTTTPL